MAQPGTPTEQPMLDTTDARLQHLEHSLYDMHNRLSRTEEYNHSLSNRHQVLLDGLVRSYQVGDARCSHPRGRNEHPNGPPHVR